MFRQTQETKVDHKNVKFYINLPLSLSTERPQPSLERESEINLCFNPPAAAAMITVK